MADNYEIIGEVSYGDIFTDEFINRYTSFATIDDFFDGGGYVIKSLDDIEEIPDEELDAFVKKSTEFISWKQMTDAAVDEYLENNL